MSIQFQTLCSNGDVGWGRKKREITPGGIDKRSVASRSTRRGIKGIDKRQAADDVFDIDVGGKVKIVEKYTEVRKYDVVCFLGVLH